MDLVNVTEGGEGGREGGIEGMKGGREREGHKFDYETLITN